jgi:cellulose synthase/poly-beta-1,6-N-acetylglucosamine synthase-like glycosyltransferase
MQEVDKLKQRTRFDDTSQEQPENDHETLGEIDLSMNLYFVEKILKNSPFMKAKGISEEILKTEGIYIETKKCKELVKKYHFVSYKSYLLSFVFTVISIITFVWLNDSSLLEVLFAAGVSPLVFNIFHEIGLMLRFFRFTPKELLPKAVGVSDKLPSVAVLIPSCNEPFAVAKMTFDSAIELIYTAGKKEIVVVDNSDIDFGEYELWKNYVESFSHGGKLAKHDIKVSFIHRDGREGFKPRNLDIALKTVSSEYIMYLDVDSTLKADTLLRVVPQLLIDKRLAFVQLYTVPTNTLVSSTLAFAQGIKSYTQRIFLVMSSHGGHGLFYGHNAIWRTSAVRAIGECLELYNGEVVVTEDLSMSLRAVQKGYQGKGAWVQSGEWVPTSMRETEAMWLRWSVGTFQVFAKHFSSAKKCKRFNKEIFFSWIQHITSLINNGLLPLCVASALLFQSEALMSLAALNLLPRLVMTVCAYGKLSLDGMKPLEKIKQCYIAFFVLDSFINWICSVGLVRYLSGQKQGWTPTGKSYEGIVPWSRVVRERWLMTMFSITTISYSCYLLMTMPLTIQLFLVAACGFWGINTLLSIVLFGRSRMESTVEQAVKTGTVQHYENFY